MAITLSFFRDSRLIDETAARCALIRPMLDSISTSSESCLESRAVIWVWVVDSFEEASEVSSSEEASPFDETLEFESAIFS